MELLITAGVIYPRIPQSPYSPSPIFGKFILAPGVYIIPNKPSLGHFLNSSSSSPHSSSVNWKPLICVANINKPRMCPAARINQHLLYPHHHVASIVHTKPAGLPMYIPYRAGPRHERHSNLLPSKDFRQEPLR